MSQKNRHRTFSPEVAGLEKREVPATTNLASHAAIRMATNSSPTVLPLRTIAGKWNSNFFATALGTNYFQGLPATTSYISETKAYANKLETSITGGSMPNGWAYTITGNSAGKLTYTMSDPFNPSIKLDSPGRRVGPGTWIFDTTTNFPAGSTTTFRTTFVVMNRNYYSVATSVGTPQGMLPLYIDAHERIKP